MYLVTIIQAYIGEEQHKFSTLKEANDFLYDEGFVYDSFDEDIHCWSFDKFTFGTVEEAN